MKKKNIIFILSIVLLILIMAFLVFAKVFNKSNLIELNVDEVIEKLENKETFILCVSQTICSHCNSYKPKLEKISKEYDLEIFYIDIDKYSKEQKELFRDNVSFNGNTPVTIFFKEGDEVTTSNRISGNVSSEKIIDKLKKNGFIEE